MSDVRTGDFLSEGFEAHRSHLRVVAYRMLGSLSEADDAVQDVWLELSRADSSAIHNLGRWLTTVVARRCLDMLRSRTSRREEPFGVAPPDSLAGRAGGTDPAEEVLMADSVGLALLVVLETLKPAERVAFVLHDVFDMPFDEIAPIVERTPDAARQLASRARRRVRERKAVPDADVKVERSVVDAFAAAARDGDFHRLVAVLDPEVVLRADAGAMLAGRSIEIRGAEQVARGAQSFSRLGLLRLPVLVNGAAGLLCMLEGKPFSVMGF